MAESFATAGGDYLEQLLRAAIDVPAAPADPAGGRVVARLMVTLGAMREDERLEPYLSCSPGRRSVYEVTCYDEPGRPATRVTDLMAGQAVRAATGFAAARPHSRIEVVARDDAGRERCVLVARGPQATYLFPEPGVVDHGDSVPAQVPVPVGRPDPMEAQWAALTQRLESLPTTEEVVAGLRDGLTGITTDLRERLGSLSTTEELIGALRDLLGGMTVELDAAAIEDAVHAALDELPQIVAAAATFSEVPEVEVPIAADLAAVGHHGPARAEEVVGRDTPVAPSSVTINAPKVADQVYERPAEHEDPPAGNRRRAHPPRLDVRPSWDRAVEDALALVALSGRRR